MLGYCLDTLDEINEAPSKKKMTSYAFLYIAEEESEKMMSFAKWRRNNFHRFAYQQLLISIRDDVRVALSLRP